jgi:hypothetical protein
MLTKIMKDGKILQYSSHICLFCGEEMNEKWDNFTQYYECDCPDAVKKREIDKRICELQSQIPKHKFVINEKQVLYKKEDW